MLIVFQRALLCDLVGPASISFGLGRLITNPGNHLNSFTPMCCLTGSTLVYYTPSSDPGYRLTIAAASIIDNPVMSASVVLNLPRRCNTSPHASAGRKSCLLETTLVVYGLLRLDLRSSGRALYPSCSPTPGKCEANMVVEHI